MVISNLGNIRLTNAASPPVSGLLDLFCAVTILKLGSHEVNIMKSPRGYCAVCCPLDETKHIEYWYCSKNVPNCRLVSQVLPGASHHAGVNPDWPTVFFVHGWTESQTSRTMQRIKEVYLKRPEPWNIFLVNWNSLATYLYYDRAAKNTRVVGENLGRFLVKNFHSTEIDMQRVHLIGFSLGAHVAGFAGKHFLKRVGFKLNRITGLDPAYPNFETAGCRDRLCDIDANFVDILHADNGGLGLPRPIGHVDFYANGGAAYQPGCTPTGFSLDALKVVEQLIPCSHLQAVFFYAYTVLNPTIFPVERIDPVTSNKNPVLGKNYTVYLGFGISPQERGIYYISTFLYPPRSQKVWNQLVRSYS